MPPPRGEGMTGSPPSGPALPMRARAGDPTGVHSSNPTHSPGRLTSFLLRHHKPAPNDGVDVKDLRPLTRSALPGRSWTPTPQPALPKSGGGRKKKDQPAVGRHSLTGPVLSGMTMPCDARTRDYLARRITEGKTRREAIRCLSATSRGRFIRSSPPHLQPSRQRLDKSGASVPAHVFVASS